ncbi:4-hydroxy-3-methylbut-2-enyl diphosphate reductase [Patescibacteria group bacterium]
MKVLLVPKIGFCFGVKRAIDISVECLKKYPKPCQVLGPLVHNEFVVKKLKKKGVKFINSIKEARGGTIIISAHGEDPKVIKEIQNKGFKMIDATCLLVTRVQDLAKNLQKKGFQVVIIGDKNHKEVESIRAVVAGKAVVVGNEKDVEKLKTLKNLGVIVQTTQNPEKVEKILKKLKKKFKNVEFCNTLCPTVQSYQKEVRNLAKNVDVMLIVGSKTSANTMKLAEVAKMCNNSVYHLESASQLKKSWLKGAKKVGLAGGTSTPDWLIQEVVQKIKNYD